MKNKKLSIVPRSQAVRVKLDLVALHADENLTISRAQSVLTAGGVRGPTLPYAQALDVVRWASRSKTL